MTFMPLMTQPPAKRISEPLEECALAALSEELHSRIARLEAECAALRVQVTSGRAAMRLLLSRVADRLGLAHSSKYSTAIPSGGPPYATGTGTVGGLPLPTAHALARARSRGVRIGAIIDVGASDGQWTDMCRTIYPKARALLLEAHAAHRPALDRFVASRQDVEYSIAAVGPERRQLWFEETSDPFGGRIHAERHRAEFKALEGTTIDYEVAARGFFGPLLLKLDTHGFEIPILEGARATLEHAQLVVVECYPFRLGHGAPVLHELCTWMWERGFMLIDLAEPVWRERDGCLWQVDLVFTPRARPECGVTSWS